jgi:hypothetical protein
MSDISVSVRRRVEEDSDLLSGLAVVEQAVRLVEDSGL